MTPTGVHGVHGVHRLTGAGPARWVVRPDPSAPIRPPEQNRRT